MDEVSYISVCTGAADIMSARVSGDYCTLFLAPGPLSRSAVFFFLFVCLIHNPVMNLSMLVVKNCLLIV